MTDGSNSSSPVHGKLVDLGRRSPGGVGIRGTVIGYYFDPPENGSRFRVFSERGGWFDTSPVQRVERIIPGNAILIVTENSVYEWKADKG